MEKCTNCGYNYLEKLDRKTLSCRNCRSEFLIEVKKRKVEDAVEQTSSMPDWILP